VGQSNIISAGYIDTCSAKTLAMEVVVQAVQDYRRLKTYKKKKVKWAGTKVVVEAEIQKIKRFFTEGGADAWLETGGVRCTGSEIWKTISQRNVDGWGSGVFTNRIFL